MAALLIPILFKSFASLTILFITLSFCKSIQEEIVERYHNGNKKLVIKYKDEGSDKIISEKINIKIQARVYGLYSTIVTNGDRLDKNSVYNLYQSGLDYINVSLYDGAEQIDKFVELFESIGIDEKMYTAPLLNALEFISS